MSLLTLSRDERLRLLFEIELHDLRDLPAIQQARERQRWDEAQWLRWDYDALFRLMDDLRGWSRPDTTTEFQLTLSADQLGRVLRRLHRRATRHLLDHAADERIAAADPTGKIQQSAAAATLAADLLDRIATEPTRAGR